MNDAALTFEPETSVALGFGFPSVASWAYCTWRLCVSVWRGSSASTSYSTSPNVVYEVTAEDGTKIRVDNPSEFPDGKISEVREPMVAATILTPNDFVGSVMELCQERRQHPPGNGLSVARTR